MLRPLLDLLIPPSCWSCRGPVHAGAALCGNCAASLDWRAAAPRPDRSGPVTRLATPLDFAGPAKALVHALKFRSAPGVAALMAAHVVHALPVGFLDPTATIVPVPAHPGRRRRRGYDHAEALAQAIAARSGQPVAAVLVRAGGRAAHQRGTGRAARLRGAALTITATGPAPARCLLVDDVRTTGATLDACARALREAGARRVDAIAYAQAPKH